MVVHCRHGSQERDDRIRAQQGGRCRSGQVTSVGHAEQVPGRAGTEGALTFLNCCKKCGLMPKDDFVCLL